MSLLDRFKPDAELTDKFNAAIAENESLVSQLTDLQAKVSELQGLAVIVSEKDAEITNLQTDRATLANQVETLTAQASVLSAELETEKAKTTPEALQSLALATLSEAGQPAPIAGGEDDASPLTEAQIRKKFATMPAGSARSAFYREHHSILSK